MTRKIKETKATCKSCGHVWYYGKADVLQSVGNNMSNAGKNMTCCGLGGCLPDKKTTDPTRCPKCGSRASEKETVTHEV